VQMGNGKQFASADKGQDFIASEDFFVKGDVRAAGGGKNLVLFLGDQRDCFLVGIEALFPGAHQMFSQEATHDVGFILSGGGNKGIHVQQSGRQKHLLVRSVSMKNFGILQFRG